MNGRRYVRRTREGDCRAMGLLHYAGAWRATGHRTQFETLSSAVGLAVPEIQAQLLQALLLRFALHQ